MKTITIPEIAAAYAEGAGITKVEATDRVKAVIGYTTDGLIECAGGEADKVFLSGFGTFTAETKPARTMKSNLDGKEHEIPEKIVVKFSPASDLKTRVNS